jgi:hypothetical protein
VRADYPGVRTTPAPDPTGRWFGVGHSTSRDSAAAGAEAVSAALDGRTPSLVLVFASIEYDFAALLEPVCAAVPDDAVVSGCSSDGEVAYPEPSRSGGVVVVALGGSGFQVRARAERGISADRRAAGAAVAAGIDAIDRPHRALLLLADGMTGLQHEIVRGAYAVAGPSVPLAGGCAADALRYERTYQFIGDGRGAEVLSDGLVGIALGSDAPLGVGVAHGWRKQGEPFNVTSSNEGLVHTLDDERALDAYARVAGLDPALADDPAAFRQAAFAVPLGLSRRTGEDIRVIHAGDTGDGSIACLADVPQGALAWPMETDHEALIEGAAESCRDALAMLGGAPALGLVAFDCGARAAKLGPDGLRREVARIAEVLGDTPFGGLYTYGEFARTQGSRGMHHLTCVTLAIG